ncbi:hypothetical protein DD235_12350 [Corticimicrobacter populi]|uniref:Uncharacterized protein n=1 Tax=Corticimicrobacter populi TaxID=2175229 RepID=A0A2V1K211_9BURK|nr:hypothetical protein DD235_12350 [Corticimicrobacter populi]
MVIREPPRSLYLFIIVVNQQPFSTTDFFKPILSCTIQIGQILTLFIFCINRSIIEKQTTISRHLGNAMKKSQQIKQ